MPGKRKLEVEITGDAKGVRRAIDDTDRDASTLGDKMGKSLGGAAKVAASPLDRLQVMIGNAQEWLGNKLVPVVVTAADWLGERLPGAVTWVGDRLDWLSTNVLPVLSDAWSVVWDKVQEGVGWLAEHREFLIGFGVAIAGAFAVWAASAALAAAASIAAAAVPLLIIGAIGALVGAVIWAYNNWQWFHDAVQVAVAWVRENVPPAWEAVKAAIAGVVDWLTTTVWPAIQTFYGVVVGAGEAFVGFVRSHWEQISSIVSSVWDHIVNTVRNAWTIVTNLFDFFHNILTGKWGDAWHNIVNILGAVWDQIKSLVSNGWDVVKNLFLAFGGFIQDNAWRMWEGIKTAFKAVINWIIDRWNALEFQVPGFDLGPVHFGGFTLGVPDIPRLHSGGTYQAPVPGGEGLALLRDGEVVRTPEQARADGQAGGGLTIIVEGHAVLERDLLRILDSAAAAGYRPSWASS